MEDKGMEDQVMEDQDIVDEESRILAWKPRMGVLTVAEKIEQAKLLKEQANLFYKRGELKKARTKYAHIFAYINGISAPGDGMEKYAKATDSFMSATLEESQEIKELQIAAWSNLALCYLKFNSPEKVIEYCNKILQEQKTHTKAMYRKAQAHAMMKNYDLAENLLKNIITQDPNNAAARKELQSVLQEKRIYEVEANRTSGFKNIFNNKKSNGLF